MKYASSSELHTINSGDNRESYYYLDIIVHHHRLRWTQQYVLTLMAVNDPRIASTIQSLLEMTENAEQDEAILELREFIKRQQIILGIRNGQTEKARYILEKKCSKPIQTAPLPSIGSHSPPQRNALLHNHLNCAY